MRQAARSLSERQPRIRIPVRPNGSVAERPFQGARSQGASAQQAALRPLTVRARQMVHPFGLLDTLQSTSVGLKTIRNLGTKPGKPGDSHHFPGNSWPSCLPRNRRTRPSYFPAGETMILPYDVSGGVPLSVTSAITWKLLPVASSGIVTVARWVSLPARVISFA